MIAHDRIRLIGPVYKMQKPALLRGFLLIAQSARLGSIANGRILGFLLFQNFYSLDELSEFALMHGLVKTL